MLEGWYCRTLANEQAAASQNHQDDDDNDPDDSGSDDSQDAGDETAKQIDYKAQYQYLKQKFKFLLYENEFFQDALRSSQRRLLKVSRDRSFLLDRLLQYEKPENSSSESDETETSEDENAKVEARKRKVEANGGNSTKPNPAKKRKTTKSKQPSNQAVATSSQAALPQDGHMTSEEVERHLQSIQSVNELAPERAPPTVPNEMFSNEPSLDSESNDQLIETSPSNMGEDCLSVDMNVMNPQM